MNYIELINQFWRMRRSKIITSVEADLYYYLMNVCNELNWENPFEHPNKLICATIGVTEKTMIAARNRLKQKGLIDFQPGKRKSKSPVYTLLYCKNSSTKESKKESKNDSKKESKKESKKGNLITKPNETNNTPISPKSEKQLSLPFESENFRELWEQLLELPKWRKKPLSSLKLALKKLGRYEDSFACELMEQAIEGNYQGVVFPDTDEKYQKWKKVQSGFDPKNPITQPKKWEKF
jgi:hypothetical protein